MTRQEFCGLLCFFCFFCFWVVLLLLLLLLVSALWMLWKILVSRLSRACGTITNTLDIPQGLFFEVSHGWNWNMAFMARLLRSPLQPRLAVRRGARHLSMSFVLILPQPVSDGSAFGCTSLCMAKHFETPRRLVDRCRGPQILDQGRDVRGRWRASHRPHPRALRL